MKPNRKILLGCLVLLGLPFALSGCFTRGYIGVSNGIYYGPHRDPWFHDDPWMDGDRWHRSPQVDTTVSIYLYPPRHRR